MWSKVIKEPGKLKCHIAFDTFWHGQYNRDARRIEKNNSLFINAVWFPILDGRLFYRQELIESVFQ